MIRQVKLHTLSEEQKSAFEALFCSSDPSAFDANSPAFTLAAFSTENPVGLIHGYLYKEAKEALLTHFHPHDQKTGIKLMQEFLAHVKKEGIRILTFSYPVNSPTLEKILEKTGWEPPQLLTRRYFFKPESFHPNWFIKKSLLPTNYTLFPWKEATKLDLEKANQLEKSNPQILSYSPFNQEYPLDTLTSLGLRKNGELAGWLINHRLTPNQLRYSAFYLLPEIRGEGIAIALLRESIRQHVENEPDLVGLMEINFKLSESRWIRFIKRALAPSAILTEDINYTFHKLDI